MADIQMGESRKNFGEKLAILDNLRAGLSYLKGCVWTLNKIYTKYFKKLLARSVWFGTSNGLDSESDQLIPEISELIIRLKVPERRGRKRNFLI